MRQRVHHGGVEVSFGGVFSRVAVLGELLRQHLIREIVVILRELAELLGIDVGTRRHVSLDESVETRHVRTVGRPPLLVGLDLTLMDGGLTRGLVTVRLTIGFLSLVGLAALEVSASVAFRIKHHVDSRGHEVSRGVVLRGAVACLVDHLSVLSELFVGLPVEVLRQSTELFGLALLVVRQGLVRLDEGVETTGILGVRRTPLVVRLNLFRLHRVDGLQPIALAIGLQRLLLSLLLSFFSVLLGLDLLLGRLRGRSELHRLGACHRGLLGGVPDDVRGRLRLDGSLGLNRCGRCHRGHRLSGLNRSLLHGSRGLGLHRALDSLGLGRLSLFRGLIGVVEEVLRANGAESTVHHVHTTTHGTACDRTFTDVLAEVLVPRLVECDVLRHRFPNTLPGFLRAFTSNGFARAAPASTHASSGFLVEDGGFDAAADLPCKERGRAHTQGCDRLRGSNPVVAATTVAHVVVDSVIGVLGTGLHAFASRRTHTSYTASQGRASGNHASHRGTLGHGTTNATACNERRGGLHHSSEPGAGVGHEAIERPAKLPPLRVVGVDLRLIGAFRFLACVGVLRLLLSHPSVRADLVCTPLGEPLRERLIVLVSKGSRHQIAEGVGRLLELTHADLEVGQ